jgi:hypothetical protein
MKKMKKKLFVLLTIFVLANFNQGCIGKDHYLIIDIDFHAASILENNKDKGHIKFGCTSLIKDKLIFVISHETKFVTAYISGFGSVCYATTRGQIWDNKLLENTFSMTFDKTFTYNGNTIPAMTNIFEIESIVREIDRYKNYTSSFCRNSSFHPHLALHFSDNFFRNSVFDTTEEYIVTFSCKTSDDNFFEKTTMIKFEK